MTTPASGPISIQSLKNEWPQYNYNEMYSWGVVILGKHSSGQSTSLSEFYNRSNEVSYAVGVAGASWSSGMVYVGTKWGTVGYFIHNIPGQFQLNFENNVTPWANLKRIIKPSGEILYPGNFSWGGEYYSNISAESPAGTMTLVYNG